MGIASHAGAQRPAFQIRLVARRARQPTPAPFADLRDRHSGGFSHQHRQQTLGIEVLDAKRKIDQGFARPAAGRRDRGKVGRRPAEIDLRSSGTTESLMRAEVRILFQRAPRIPAASSVILRSRALSSALSNSFAAVTPDSRNLPKAEPRARPERCVARRSAGSTAGASGRPPTAWPGLPARGGRKERMKCPRPSRMPVCGGVEKEIEGATLVSTRHSPPIPIAPLYTWADGRRVCARAVQTLKKPEIAAGTPGSRWMPVVATTSLRAFTRSGSRRPRATSSSITFQACSNVIAGR